MSVFYNLKTNANSGEDREAKFFNSGIQGAVVAKQNEYLCGVRRFKIPIANIPLWRFYNKQHKIGFSLAGGFNQARRSFLPAQSVCDFPTIAPDLFSRESLKYNVDDRAISVFGENNKFVSCESQEEICDELNRTLTNCLSYAGSVYNDDVQTNATLFSQKPVAEGDYGVLDYQTILVGFQIVEQGEGLQQNPASILSGIEINLSVFSITGEADLSKFNFYVNKYKIGEGPKTATAGTIKDDATGNNFTGGIVKGTPVASYPMMMSTLVGVKTIGSGFATIDISSGNGANAEGSRKDCLFDVQKCDDSYVDFNVGFNGTTSATDLPAIMGTRCDGYNWFLIAENTTFMDNGKIPSTGLISNSTLNFPITGTGAGNIAPKLKLRTMPIQANQGKTPSYADNQLQDDTQFLFPYFKYNEDTKKICLQISEFWNNVMNFKLYMSKSLDSMIQFTHYREVEVNSSNFTKYIFTPTAGFKENVDGGYIYSFNRGFYKRGIGETNTGRNKFSVIEYYERNSGNFARDLLNSIKVFTSSIAVIGEAVGNGDNVERVLTDFVLDTSVVGRDYLVYTPQGGIRYYELDSPSALRQVDATIFFEDIYGITRPLFIPAGMECSMKLEFRPKNMVYNYIGM